jgi:son of sevenless-like protein
MTVDPAFIKTFLMTYKSFTTLDELFDLLVQRFLIQPPPNLTASELAEWKKLKQHIIQMRFVGRRNEIDTSPYVYCSVLNTFKSMVVDDDVLEKEDLFILDRMKEFSSNEEVIKFAAAKQLLIHIERAVCFNVSYPMETINVDDFAATRRRCHKDDDDRSTNPAATDHAEDIQEAQIA